MSSEVGAYEAKTRLPELLRGVQVERRSYTITLRGKPIALLTPVKSVELDAEHTVAEMLAFMQSVSSIGVDDLKSLIEEGRA